MDATTESPQHITYFQQVPAIVSCISSGLVILTFIKFKKLRKLRYVELVYYISVSDFIGSFAITIGSTEDRSFACMFQGICSSMGLLSAVFWTVVVTYQVWLLVNRKSIIEDLTYYHIICWGLPCVLSILPLTTNTYGTFDDDPGWCYIVNTAYSPSWSEVFWVMFSFSAWIFISLVANCVLIILIIIRLKAMHIIPETTKITIKKLILYPAVIFISWFFSTVTNIHFKTTGESPNETWELLDNIGIFLAILQGLFFSLIFFTMNPLVRHKWKVFLYYAFTRSYNTILCKNTENESSRGNFEIAGFRVEDELDYMTNCTEERETSMVSIGSTDERITAGLFQYNSSYRASLSNKSGNNSNFEDSKNSLQKIPELENGTVNPLNEEV